MRRAIALVTTVLSLVWVPRAAAQAATGLGFIRITNGWNGEPSNGDSGTPAISADGRFVAFVSSASNLVPNDTNGVEDVFVYDRSARTMTRESVAAGGSQANNFSAAPSLSADGRYVVFRSLATNLVPDVTKPPGGSGINHIYVRDRVLDVTTLVDRTLAGGVDAVNGSTEPVMSDDGRFVAFTSSSPDLVAGDTGGCSDVFVRDVLAGTTELVRGPTDGAACAKGSQPTITADGRYVAFSSSVVFGSSDVFIRDRTGQTTTFEVTGAQALLSGDGRFLAFFAVAGLGPRQGTYIRDRTTGQVAGPLRTYPTISIPHMSRTTPYLAYVSRALLPSAPAPDEAFVLDLIGQTTLSLAPGIFISEVSGVSSNALALVTKVALVPSPANDVNDIYVAATADSHAPGAPGNLAASISDTTVTLTWSPPSTGDAPVSYVIVAGSQPGRTDQAIFSTGSTATTFSASVPPSSRFYIRVHAANGAGTSPPSNEVAAVIGSGLRPPLNLTATVSGSTVTLTWDVQPGETRFGYIVEAGSSSGLSDLASIYRNGDFPRSYVATGVPAGTYFVRLRATNALGASLPSNEVMITVR